MMFPGRDWQEATPESQEVDATKLKLAVDYLEKNVGQDGVKRLALVRKRFAPLLQTYDNTGKH